eukprot:6491069-Amphidinium_carterae.2
MQDIVQRGEMTITKIQTTRNPADVLTKHLPEATINSHLDRLCLQAQLPNTVSALHGLPTSKRMTIGMIGLQSTSTNETQPVVTTATAAAESSMMRQSQALQMRRRTAGTPPRNVQPQREIVARDSAVEMVVAQRQMTITLPWSFFVSLLMTILLCMHYTVTTATLALHCNNQSPSNS